MGAVAGYPIGYARLMVWTYDRVNASQIGICTGQADTLANGSTSGVYVSTDCKSNTFTINPPTPLEIQGGDKIKATPSFGGGKAAPFDVILSSIDPVLSALVSGAAAFTTNTYAAEFGYNANRTIPKTLGCALQQRFVTLNQDELVLTRVIPRASMSFRPGAMTFRGESDATLHISPLNATKSFDGMSYGSTGKNFGFEEDTADHYDVETANPWHIIVQRSDAASTSVTTIYKPISTVVTLNATPNTMWKNGTATALSAVTLLGAVTLAAAGTAGDLHVIRYETQFVPV